MKEAQTEFEIKALAPSEEELHALLSGLGEPRSYEQVDLYFDNAERSLFLQGVFLRMRDGQEFEVKYNPDADDLRHLSCEEMRYSLPVAKAELGEIEEFLGQIGISTSGDYSSLAELLEASGLSPWIKLHKHRSVYTMPDVELCVDRVQGLGKFIEIEVADPTSNQKYVEWAETLGLKNLGVGYVELYLREHDREMYLAGRYVLPEDRSV